MITIEELKNLGADVQTGLARCVGKEDLYLKLVSMGLGDVKFEELETALQTQNLDKAFELCHALKGVIGNLALTPMFEALSSLTEKLRNHEAADYSAMYLDIMFLRSKFLGS